MRVTAGELLYYFRKEKNVDAKSVCRGLCAQSSMSYYENNERFIDNFMFERLMGRMGITTEEFSFMVTKDEYEYRKWKDNVYNAIEKKEWENLKILLEYNVKDGLWLNKKLHRQFLLYAESVYFAGKLDYARAAEILQSAAAQTFEFHSISASTILLDVMEFQIIALYLCYGHRSGIISSEEGKRIFYSTETLIYKGLLDIREKAKIYPKLVCIGLQEFGEFFTDEEKHNLCENAIGILRDDKSFFDIIEVFRCYISLLEKEKSTDAPFYKKQYEVFGNMLLEENIDIQFRPEWINSRKTKVYFIHEYLYTKRKEKALTQEKLSEEVCAVETYSRLERGERVPSRKNLLQLSNKLDMNWIYCRGEIESTDSEIYELRRKVRHANVEGRWQDSLEIIYQLETCLDMNITENYQYIKYNEYVLKCRLGIMDKESVCRELWKLISMTIDVSEDNSRLIYYSQIEMEMIAHLAQLYRMLGQYQKGIDMIEGIVKQMKHSQLEYENQWNGFSFLLRVLASLYFRLGKYDISIYISKYVKSILLHQKSAANLPEVLDEIADGLEHKGERYSEKYMCLYRYVFYVADFFYIKQIRDGAKHYYEEKFDNYIEWYPV